MSYQAPHDHRMQELAPAQSSYTNEWAPDAQLFEVAPIEGVRLRYLVAGEGAPLLLMHTARSQLDYFQRLIPLLTGHFKVYAVDLPGHGWSSIDLKMRYSEPNIRRVMGAFIKGLDLRDLTLAGDSVGAVLSLTLAAELPDQVKHSVAVNLFDYGPGVRRANGLSNLIISTYPVPILGRIFSNLESAPILGAILRGGYWDPSKMPAALLREFRRVGRRSGYQAMMRSLVSEMPSFVAARDVYAQVTTPATLVYGSHDWATDNERRENSKRVGHARMVTLAQTGHFASLESPALVADTIIATQQEKTT